MTRKSIAAVLDGKKYGDFDEKTTRQDFKTFSQEFIKEYKDIESDEHLFIGSVATGFSLLTR